MFVQRKDAERLKARHLRRRGLSLRSIANRLGVALSSVSVWVRDIPRGPVEGTGLAAKDIEKPAPPSHHPPKSGDGVVGERRCSRCRELLPLSAFNRHGDGHQWWCRECFRAYFRERGAVHLRQVRRSSVRRRARAREYVYAYLAEHPCVDCGQANPVVLEFDHLGPKSGNIGRLVYDGASRGRLNAEIAGCEVVCANCHRRRTAVQVRSWRLDPAVLASRVLTPEQVRNLRLVHQVLERSSCADCDEGDLLVLEFDHVGPKRAAISLLARRGSSAETLKAEIAQCEVVCANCHRRRTAERGGHFRHRRSAIIDAPP
jgi:hypothetical protein